MSSSDSDLISAADQKEVEAIQNGKAVSSDEEEEEIGNDIQIDGANINEFFFMDSDEEQEKYGASTKVGQLAQKSDIVKEAKQNEANKLK